MLAGGSPPLRSLTIWEYYGEMEVVGLPESPLQVGPFPNVSPTHPLGYHSHGCIPGISVRGVWTGSEVIRFGFHSKLPFICQKRG